MEPWQQGLVDGLEDRLDRRPERRGLQVVAVDGWSGSGKTSLAAWLAPGLGAEILALDELVPGWYGLRASVEALAGEVLPALAAGRPAPVRTWDWVAGRCGPVRWLDPPGRRKKAEGADEEMGARGKKDAREEKPLGRREEKPSGRRNEGGPARLLVEGCGAGAAEVRPWLDALVWVDADEGQRRRRLAGRPDWPAYRPWWAVWAAQEMALRRDDDPRAHADAVVEGDGGALVVRWSGG